MRNKQKISKVVIIAITLVIFTGMSMSNFVVPVQADTLASKVSPLYLQPSGPRGPEGQPLINVATIVMPVVDSQKLLAEDKQRAWDQPPRFATSINVHINPATDGTWEALAGDVRLWRLHIVSADAISLNMGFSTYNMPPGGQLYLYTPDYGQVIGPFTEQDNEQHGELWTPIIEGGEVVVEISLPSSEVPQLQLELTSVNHGYVDFETAEKSGSCNVDVICPQGDPWRLQIRSVGRYTFSGSFLCTGALINNTSQDFKPYFLTANHCVNTSMKAASVVVYWNYESPTCRPVESSENATPISPAGFPNQTGAFLRATYATSDLTLLELDSAVAASVNAYWSGWDRTGANATGAVTIHHPVGHEKRISFENDATSITSYGSTTALGDGTHIWIPDWDLGTTEMGSSGSPLFNQNHLIIGQLHGGYAACGNNASDWYGRLFTSWTGGGTNSTRLSNWLDPGNIGAMTLQGLWNSGPQAAISDFNGDGITDISLFRPSNGVWYVKDQFGVQFGANGDIPVDGDYDDDGDTDVALFRPSNGVWYVKDQFDVQFGAPGDIPVQGDYDGDGDTDVALFRPSNAVWYVKDQFGVQFGTPGDIPVPGDYDGDGDTDVAIFRPSNAVWYVKDQFGVQFGAPGDIPVPGDYDGDGDTDVALFRPSNGVWYVKDQFGVQFGMNGDIPVPGDYDGDGDADVAVFRPSNGVWYVKDQFGVQFGSPDDIPIPKP